MKIMNMVKKFGSKAIDFVVSAKDKALGLLAVGTAVLVSTTPAHADLASTLKTVEDAATAGITVVSTSVAAVYVSVFGLVLLGAGIAWLFGAVKKR